MPMHVVRSWTEKVVSDFPTPVTILHRCSSSNDVSTNIDKNIFIANACMI
jgi:hypothetical protein